MIHWYVSHRDEKDRLSLTKLRPSRDWTLRWYFCLEITTKGTFDRKEMDSLLKLGAEGPSGL